MRGAFRRVRRLGLLAALVLPGWGAAPVVGQTPATRVVMLGTGTPNPDPERSGPAVAVVVNGTAYLVDAGPGVMRRAAQAAARHGIPGLEAKRIGTVFLTHLHSDHTAGLPDVIHTGWVLEREEPLRVFGPAGTRRMTDHLTAAWAVDIEERTAGVLPIPREGWRVEAADIVPGEVYRDSNVVVRAMAVPHGGLGQALAYRFETPDRRIVISGDTRPSEAVVEACDGCDLLIHEVYSAERFTTRSAAWQRYHASAHVSTTELAAIATRARPRLLVLYHQLFWGTDDAGLVAELRAAGYTGAVVSARDLDVW